MGETAPALDRLESVYNDCTELPARYQLVPGITGFLELEVLSLQVYCLQQQTIMWVKQRLHSIDWKVYITTAQNFQQDFSWF
jgi:hypothetical protein